MIDDRIELKDCVFCGQSKKPTRKGDKECLYCHINILHDDIIELLQEKYAGREG